MGATKNGCSAYESSVDEVLNKVREQIVQKRPQMKMTQLKGAIAECLLQLDALEGECDPTRENCESPAISPMSSFMRSPVSSPGIAPLGVPVDHFGPLDKLRSGVHAVIAISRMKSPLHQPVDFSVSKSDLGIRVRSASLAFRSPSVIPPHNSPLTPRSGHRFSLRKRVMQNRPCLDSDPLVIAMCGLPGTGKSYIAQRICGYLGWRGVPVKIFNAGDYRRKVIGPESNSANFFDPNNAQALDMREKMAEMAMEDCCNFISCGGQVGIFDATNTTTARRKKVFNYFTAKNIPKNRILFYESVCNDEELLRKTVLEVKMQNADYGTSTNKEKAFTDFMERRSNYEKVYETLTPGRDSKLTWIQNRDVGSYVQVRNVTGWLPNKILQFTVQLPTVAAPIFLCEADASQSETILGGDNSLSDSGRVFAERLQHFVKEIKKSDKLKFWKDEPIEVWHSTRQRAEETVAYLEDLPPGTVDIKTWDVLDELNFGSFDGLDPKEASSLPEMDDIRSDPFFSPFPKGESLCQLCRRLDPFLDHITSLQRPVLIVSHEVCVFFVFIKKMRPVLESSKTRSDLLMMNRLSLARDFLKIIKITQNQQHVLWCLLAYCLHMLPEDCVSITLPPNNVLEVHLEAKPGKSWMERYDLESDDVLRCEKLKPASIGLGRGGCCT